MDKRDVFCYALGMLLNAAEDTVNELRGAGVNHPALARLEVTHRVVEVLSNPRLDINAEDPKAFSAVVNGLFEVARREVLHAR